MSTFASKARISTAPSGRTSSGACTSRSGDSRERSRVGVRVEDVPGADDVPDASCRIRVELLPTRRTLRQEAVDGNLYVAIDLAIDLATERIARTFERELDWARSVGAVRNSEAAASQPRRRRSK